MKMLATKISLNTARCIHRSAQHLFKMFPVIYSNTPDFGYSNEKQKSWAKVYPGWSRQYPIAIFSGTVEVIGMAPLHMEGYDKIVPGRLAIGNNGYTVSISLIQDNKNRQCNNCRPPTISGGLLRNVYEFEGLHFHWTKKNNRGCEHVIDNIRYPLEMHLIHRNIKYDCIETALEHEDGLCAAAVFFDIAEMPYKAFNSIIENFIYIQNTNTNITLDCGLVLDSLLPINIQKFYTYKGSLLSPPYNKSINWIIFCHPIYISFDQFSEFQLLQKNQDNEIFDNCQNIQPIEYKKVYARDPNLPFIPACDVPCPNIPIPTNTDVSCPHVPTSTYNKMYFPISPNDCYKSNEKVVSNPTSINKELLDPTLTKEHYQSTASYNEMYFPISPKDENVTNKKIELNHTATNNEEFGLSLTREEHHYPTAAYNQMYFPVSPKDENITNKKTEPNPSSTNREILDPTKNENHNSTATYNEMYFKDESASNKIIEPNSPTNREILDPTLTKEENHQSTAAYNEMYFPISPKNENASTKKIETNSTSTNKEALNPSLAKEEYHQSTATYNEMYFPISPKDENASNKKIETNSTNTNKETLDPNLTKEENHSPATYNEMYIPISSKVESHSNQKMEPNKGVLEPNLNKKDAMANKKEFCNPITTTNVLSPKTQRGLIANIKNKIKDVLIKFFSK